MPSFIAAGDRDKRITIERERSTSVDAAGHPVVDWQLLAKRWARQRYLSGRELWNAQQVQPDVTQDWTFKQLSGLTPKDRIRYDGRTFEILSVLEQDEEHVCMVKESV